MIGHRHALVIHAETVDVKKFIPVIIVIRIPVTRNVTCIGVPVFELLQEVHIFVRIVILEPMKDVNRCEIVVAVALHIRRLDPYIIVINIDVVYGVIISLLVTKLSTKFNPKPNYLVETA